MNEYKNIIDFSEGKDNLSYETCERLKEFIAASGKTQAAAACELGVSEALLSQFLSGTYKCKTSYYSYSKHQIITTHPVKLTAN